MMRPRYYRHRVGGDIFFRDKDVYFVLTKPNGDVYHGDDSNSQPMLEVGIISADRTNLEIRLRSFAQAIEQTLVSAQLSESESLTFAWKAKTIESPHLTKIINMAEDQGLRYSVAEYSAEQLEAAKNLCDKNLRNLLLNFAKATFTREPDLFRKGKQQNHFKDIQLLKSNALLNSEYLLKCHKTNSVLTRVKNPDQLKSSEVGNLPCPSCGVPFRDEQLSEVFLLSELGKTLSAKSHWMTIWITDKLIKLGVPSKSILWNLSDSGEEIDLLVSFLGYLWIFELKDREFGAGDAYPLNYRQVRYKANRAVIVTAEKVSRDAKRVFEELSRETKRGKKNGSQNVIYIEGLDVAEKVLQQEFSNAALQYAMQKLSILDEISDYNISGIVRAWAERSTNIKFDEGLLIEDSIDDEIPF
jgi:hypothetical protein